MRVSKLFTKTLKQAPAGEVSKNAQLLIRAGYVYKEMAGVYAYLPLGIKVLENIKKIVRAEMNAIGSNELAMTNLQRQEVWQKTTRWDDEVVDVWFKTYLKDGTQLGLGWSHEEPVIEMLKNYLNSYKDLPISLYQIQTKLRNELRAKSGIMRGREFIMKDMYSFHASKSDMDEYYNQVIEAYKRVYEKLGIGDETYVTFASGGAFTKFSHEFQTICDAGEDIVYIHKGKNVAINEEVAPEAATELGINKDELEKVKTAEVGNIFNFGTQKTDELGLYYTDENGDKQSIYSGSYGIGITRLMGVIAEKTSDEKGLVWPVNIAPYTVYLISIGDVEHEANEVYRKLQQKSIEVLYDDRDERPGVKFADSELLGIPYRVTISERNYTGDGASHKLEFVSRESGQQELLTLDELIARIA